MATLLLVIYRISNGCLACAYEILSSSVDDITNICALHEQKYIILAELQTKEKTLELKQDRTRKAKSF